MRRSENRRPSALTAAERERIRRSREALVDGGLLVRPPGAGGVPQVIEKSWRRCVGQAVPVAPDRLDYRDPEDATPVLRRAAGPVLERLAHSFADVPVAMVLSDATGRIVLRHVDVRRQRDLMDRASAAEGFDFSERSVGTNGLGTVLVERRPVLVRGPEHYNPLLEGITCAGTPVVEPGTGRLLGSFSLACPLRDVHPLMTAMAADIGRQIESRVLDDAGEWRRLLVTAHLAAVRDRAGALVVDDEAVLTNRPALAHAGPELHPLLWRFLSEHAPSGPVHLRVPLSDGHHDALVEPIAHGGRRAYGVRLLAAPADRPDRGRDTHRASPSAPARLIPAHDDPAHDDPAHDDPLHHDEDVHRRLVAAVRYGETVAVTGPPGTGKLHTALRVLRRRGAGEPLVVEPQLDPDWFARAREAAVDGRPVVVRRVHAPPSPTAARLGALGATGAPLALTADLAAADDAVLGTVRRVATTVGLPSLAATREHLPSLVRAMLAELGEPLSAVRFAAPVWDRMMAWHWPGDVAELRTTVVALARRADGGTVGLDDLPDELRAPRSAGRLEAAEHEAVVGALRAAGGNRSEAARRLGIGRTTLYRKIREFGLDGHAGG